MPTNLTTFFFLGGAAVAFALAYELQFTQATLHWGRVWSGDDQGRGYQDAITPPASTAVAFAIYGLAIAVWIAGFSLFGFWRGIASLLAFMILVPLVQGLLPKPDSPHYRQLIVKSVCGRLADYVRDGDHLRAQAMAHLLEQAGIAIPQFDQSPEQSRNST